MTQYIKHNKIDQTTHQRNKRNGLCLRTIVPSSEKSTTSLNIQIYKLLFKPTIPYLTCYKPDNSRICIPQIASTVLDVKHVIGNI